MTFIFFNFPITYFYYDNCRVIHHTNKLYYIFSFIPFAIFFVMFLLIRSSRTLANIRLHDVSRRDSFLKFKYTNLNPTLAGRVKHLFCTRQSSDGTKAKETLRLKRKTTFIFHRPLEPFSFYKFCRVHRVRDELLGRRYHIGLSIFDFV